MEALKKHPCFAAVDWDVVLRQGLRPPVVPELGSPSDTSHFDEEFTRVPARLTPPGREAWEGHGAADVAAVGAAPTPNNKTCRPASSCSVSRPPTPPSPWGGDKQGAGERDAQPTDQVETGASAAERQLAKLGDQFPTKAEGFIIAL
ncbi:unnamed protein product [Heterosigma akashiwo]